MNKAILHGNCGNDPVIRMTETGKKTASFSLATTRNFKDKNGNRPTDWHRIVAWEKTAELIEKFIKKGSSLIVEGEIQYREYTDKDGIKRNITEINCSQIHFTGKHETEPARATTLDASAQTAVSKESEAPELTGNNKDDLPF